MTDYLLWPHIERMPMIKQMAMFDPVPEDKFPKVTAWIKVMKDTPGVKATITPDELHIKFAKGFQEKNVQYDF